MKKFISIILTVAMLVSCFMIGASAAKISKLDLAFVIDTTGSMEDDIDEVKENMKNYLDDLVENGLVDYRIAIVDYRDFASRSSCDPEDYPYQVQLDFTNDYDDIVEAINGLDLGNGGDWEETLCSALIDGLDELSWRNTAGKAAIVMGDAPALDPEPYTGYTKDMAIEKLGGNDTALEEDMRSKSVALLSDTGSAARAGGSSDRSKVTLFTIATSSSYETVKCFEYLAEGTGGNSYVASSSSDISDIIGEIIETIPDVVEENELSFWEKIARFFKILWYVISFQWDLIALA